MELFSSDSFGLIYKTLIKKEISCMLAHTHGLYAPRAIQGLIERSFFPHMKRIWERIIMVEMNLAARENLIPGDNEQDQFQYFILHFADIKNLEAIYGKYGALKEVWCETVTNTFQSMNLLLDRLRQDCSIISSNFSIPKLETSKITDFEPVGDPHKGLQQTTRIRMARSNNDCYEFYYKPRNLKVDIGYDKFITWWNKRSVIQHKVAKVIDCGAYGWAESISSGTCRSREELCRFYLRYGSIVAFSFIFASVDFHMENVIAAGEYPVLVDLETLFSCVFKGKAKHPIHYHLYKSLLLPTHCLFGAMELSPLSADEQNKISTEVLKKPDTKNIYMKMAAEKLELKAHKNQATLNDKKIVFYDYEKNIVEGFERTLNFIIKNKKTILMRLKASFKNAQIRLLTRSTLNYSNILYNQYHPNNLYRSNDAARHKLALSIFDVNILASEIAQIRHGDIPVFETTLRGKIVVAGDGERIRGVIDRPCLQVVTDQIAKLSPEYIQKLKDDIPYSFKAYQVRMIETYIDDKSNFNIRKNIQKDKHASNATINEYLKNSIDILYTSSLSEHHHIYWRKIFTNGEQTASANITNNCFYDGASGILLLLHFYDRYIDNSKKYTQFIHLLRKQVIQQIEQYPSAKLGAYTGTLGEMYVLLYISQGHPKQLIELYTVLENVLQKIAFTLITTEYKKYQQLDVIAGVAGTLLMLIEICHFYKTFPLAVKLEKLMQTAYQILLQYGKNLVDPQTTAGFSHGTAGVSAAIGAYMRYVNIRDKRAVALIKGNIQRENQFKADEGWLDIRKDTKFQSKSWCHGTIGIGISRLYLRPFITQSQFASDIRLCLRHLNEPQLSLAPCHGSGGDLLFLAAYKDSLSADHNRAAIIRMAETNLQGYLTQLEQRGCCVEYGLSSNENLGIMTGISGVLYCLLMQIKPVPNILCPGLFKL